MLDVLVAEPPAVLAHRQPDVVPARLVAAARAAALAPERAHRVPALDADGHRRGAGGMCLCPKGVIDLGGWVFASRARFGEVGVGGEEIEGLGSVFGG